MSIWHRKLSAINKLLDDPTKEGSPMFFMGVVSGIHKHREAAFKEIREHKEMVDLLNEYNGHLEKVEEIFVSMSRGTDYYGPKEIKEAKKHLEAAHALVLRLESVTRKVLGEEHKFLE